MRERHLFLGVLGFALLAIAVAMLIPGRQDHRPELLPWAITTHEDGSSTVFGLRLGHSSLGEAEQLFQTELELILFQSPEGRRVAEGYFDGVTLSGLAAKLVVEAALSEAELQAMFERGVRIATMGNGSRKVTLHPDDIARLRATPIASLTYLPRTHLDELLVEKRFGTPAQKVGEPGGEVVHWLYPERGLDVAVSTSGKEVLQYVAPRDFPRLVAPLLERQATP
ncbi:MAG: hypothetical protein AB1450_06285 [Pseudomonadota bacterium]